MRRPRLPWGPQAASALPLSSPFGFSTLKTGTTLSPRCCALVTSCQSFCRTWSATAGTSCAAGRWRARSRASWVAASGNSASAGGGTASRGVGGCASRRAAAPGLPINGSGRSPHEASSRGISRTNRIWREITSYTCSSAMMEIWWPIGPTAGKRAASVAEEASFVVGCVGIDDVDQPDTGGGEAVGAIAGQVELPSTVASAGCEEASVGGLVGQHRIAQIGADFVRALPDARPDHSRCRCRPCAEMCHGSDGRLDHTGDGTAPAGMGGGNHAGSHVGEQDGGAIGSDDAERHVRAVRYHGVRARPGAWRPRIVTCTTLAPCTWVSPTRRFGFAPIARAARARFSSTASREILAGEAAVEAGVGLRRRRPIE